MYCDAKSRFASGLPASMRKFKHVAQHSIERMQDALEADAGKQAYKDCINALREWLIPFFGKTDITRVDMAALKSFDACRQAKHDMRFNKRGIENHSAARNTVFDDAVTCNAGCFRPHRDVLRPDTQTHQQRHAVTG